MEFPVGISFRRAVFLKEIKISYRILSNPVASKIPIGISFIQLKISNFL